MIWTVHKLSNGMVIVFGGHGEQLPAYEGRYEYVKDSILKKAPQDTQFYHSTENKLLPVNREEW